MTIVERAFPFFWASLNHNIRRVPSSSGPIGYALGRVVGVSSLMNSLPAVPALTRSQPILGQALTTPHILLPFCIASWEIFGKGHGGQTTSSKGSPPAIIDTWIKEAVRMKVTLNIG